MRKGAVVAAAVAAAAGLSLAACSSGGSSSSAGGGGDYVVGYVNGMSGSLAVYGEYSLSYLQAVVKQTNAKGGVNGRQVEIKVLDSAAAGQNAVSAMQQMITQYHPSVIYGFTLDNDCASAAPIAAKYTTPLICATTSPAQLNPVQPYTFASQGIEAEMYKPSFEFAQQDLKLPAGTPFATIAGTGGGGGPDMANAAALAKAAGWKDVSSQLVDTTAPSVATQVSKIVAAKPKVVFAEVVGPQLSQLVHGLQAAGQNVPVIAPLVSLGLTGFEGLNYPDFYEVAQTNFVTDQTAASSAGVAQVQKILTAGGMKGSTTQNQQLGAQAILPALGIVQALQKCGTSCTGQKMASALESISITMPGFVHGYQWSSKTHAPVSSVSVVNYDPATKAIKTDASILAVPPVTTPAP